MSRPKKGRYAQKRDLGLVPHVYHRDRKGFGTVASGAPIKPRSEPCDPRKGRHCLVAA